LEAFCIQKQEGSVILDDHDSSRMSFHSGKRILFQRDMKGIHVTPSFKKITDSISENQIQVIEDSEPYSDEREINNMGSGNLGELQTTKPVTDSDIKTENFEIEQKSVSPSESLEKDSEEPNHSKSSINKFDGDIGSINAEDLQSELQRDKSDLSITRIILDLGEVVKNISSGNLEVYKNISADDSNASNLSASAPLKDEEVKPLSKSIDEDQIKIEPIAEISRVKEEIKTNSQGLIPDRVLIASINELSQRNSEPTKLQNDIESTDVAIGSDLSAPVVYTEKYDVPFELPSDHETIENNSAGMLYLVNLLQAHHDPFTPVSSKKLGKIADKVL
jgi:hypothetical protein